MKLIDYTVEELSAALENRKGIDAKTCYSGGYDGKPKVYHTMFERSIYDPELWERKVALYSVGGKVNLRKAFYDPPNYQERFEDNIIETLDEFESEIYDSFIEQLKPGRIKEWIVGMNGVLNPKKEKTSEYIDGMCFYTQRIEFMQCLMHYEISRIYSFIVHHGFGRHELEIEGII